MLSPAKAIRFFPVKAPHILVRRASTQHPPPPPRPYKSAPPSRAAAADSKPTAPTPKVDAESSSIEPRASILRYFWPWSKGIQKPAAPREEPDPARGKEATDRVVRTGVLDPRYKEAAFKVTAIISALPIVIYLGYELFRRRFEGVEQRSLPRVKAQDELR